MNGDQDHGLVPEPDRLAVAQLAVRRLGELTLRGASAAEVLQAVAGQAAQLSGADVTTVLRYEADGSSDIVALDGAPAGVTVGMRAPCAGDDAVERLWRTDRPARGDDLTRVSGHWPRIEHAGCAESLAVPIRTEGNLWGALVVASRDQPLARDVEHRLVAFGELVGPLVVSADARLQLRAWADEQAALRRVAEMVARAASLDEVFTTVAEEVSALLGGPHVELIPYDDAGRQAVAGRPARTHADDGRRVADAADPSGAASTAAVPITVEGRVRAELVASCEGPLLPAGTESRLAQFAELTTLAIAASEARARLLASRVRIAADADEARRVLQRDVHDGPQQRLVHAVIALKMARTTVERGSEAADLVEEVLSNVEQASRELRDIVQAVLPRSLGYGGLSTGLRSLVADLSLPVDVRVATPRLPAAVETTAYLIVAEALTNAVKHSRARRAHVHVDLEGETLVVEVRDDGVGGADPGHGSGMTSLCDRVDVAGGSLTVVSPPGQGTTVRAELPVRPGDDRGTVAGHDVS